MKKNLPILLIVVIFITAVSLNAQEIREVEFIETEAVQDVFADGNFAYLAASTDGMVIINISDPESLYVEGQWDNPRDAAYGISLSGNYAYLANNSEGVYSIDITEPDDPDQDGHIDTRGLARGVSTAGDYAFVADDEEGLRILDISDPDNLQELSFLNTDGYSRGVFIDGNHVFVADGSNGMVILDISNIEEPESISTFDTPGWAWKVCVEGDLAYIADGGDGGLRIVNISNLEEPQAVGAFDAPGNVYTVQVIDDYAYIAGFNCGFRVIDVSNPDEPEEVGYYNNDYVRCAFVRGEYAYVGSDEGFHVLDVSSWQEQRPNITVDPVFLEFGELRVDYEKQLELTIGNEGNIDLHFTVNIAGGAHYRVEIDEEFTIEPDSVFTLSVQFNPERDGVLRDTLVIECDDPEEEEVRIPLVGTSIRGARFVTRGEAQGVAISGDLAYVADGVEGLVIVNIANPDSMYEVGRWDNPQDAATSVTLFGDYALVANNSEGLYAIDVSDPADPDEDGHLELEGLCRGITTWARMAFIAADEAGVHIVDITDPTQMVLLGTYDTPGHARKAIYRHDHCLCIADGEAGVGFIDIADPANPDSIYWMDTPGFAHSVTIEKTGYDPRGYGEMLFVADGDSGMEVYQIRTLDQGIIMPLISLNNIGNVRIIDANLSFYGWRAISSYKTEWISITGTPADDRLIEDSLYTGGRSNDIFLYLAQEGHYYACIADPESGLLMLDVGNYYFNIEDDHEEYFPSALTLHPAFPNPFNSSTSIRFDLPAASDVELSVYDLCGRKLQTIADRNFSAGYNEISFDGRELSSGVYFIGIEKGSERILQKVALVR